MDSKEKTTVKQEQSKLWRSLEMLREAGGKERRRESRDDKGWEFRMTRRTFLKLAGAQVMMYSLAGCAKPLEKIVPYARSPEETVPGKPLYYASAVSSEGFARGVLVRSDTGRPTKIEGNPEHPDSRGATDAITQAAIYQLYDPARSKNIFNGDAPSSWNDFTAALRSRLDGLKARGGDGLRFLSRPIVSPALGGLRARILAEFPRARWHQYSPLAGNLPRQALLNLYGRELRQVYRLQNADVILSVESDFLTQGPGALAYARAFADRRETHPGTMNLNRLYAIESSPTLTGAAADHRLIVHPSETEAFVYGLLALVRGGGPGPAGSLAEEKQNFLRAATRDLRSSRSRSLVLAGPEQPVGIHMAVARINEVLRNTGRTVEYLPAFEEFPEDSNASIAALAGDLNGGKVSDLIILDGNPAYATPGDLGFAKAMRKAGFSAYLGLYRDETARLARWHVPMADELESWGDARAFDGTVTVRQPLIAPLYNGVTDYEFCMAFLNGAMPPYDEVIRAFWRQRSNRTDFNTFWQTTLHDGVMPGTASRPVAAGPRNVPLPAAASPDPETWVLQFRPDPHVLDGRFAANSWLQELPKPLTKLVWGNAVLIAPGSARKMRLKEGDVIEITTKTGSVEAPAFIVPGQAPGVLTVHLGYGRTYAGSGSGYGFDAYRLQSLAQPWQTADFTFKKKKRSQAPVTTQHHGALSGERHLLLAADLSRYEQDPHFVRGLIHAPERSETLYFPDEHLKGEYQWAMCIDLSRCTGCEACTIACQVENNIAVVGKKEVNRNREMHWIRVDRYFRGPAEAPEIYHQPVPCMHCEDAPCELVCPVEATSHSAEGLNEMTYNRCVGTRYCSNNCPYKVRRFNFFQYTHPQTSPLRLGRNPDVTIRPRGVMEKCTYCLQRITRARIAAQVEDRKIRDGEIVPACAQACPAQAIVFGDIRDGASRVSQVKSTPLNYGMLEETGARPRTTYLARIRNPNRELVRAGG